MNNEPKIEDIDPGEERLNKIYRSLVPLIGKYLGAIIVLGLILLLMFLLLPNPLAFNYSRDKTDDAIILSVLAVIAVIGLELYTFIYRGNFVLLTNRKFTQVLRKGLFARQVAELSLSDVEDVTSVKNGFFATIFNYGTLRVETAGELENFNFKFCSKPDYYGKVILDARDQYTKSGGTDNIHGGE